MRRAGLLPKAFLALTLTAFTLHSGGPTAARPLCDPNACPRQCLLCIEIFAPVKCSNGVTYSNSCFAYVACATGCVAVPGTGPIVIH